MALPISILLAMMLVSGLVAWRQASRKASERPVRVMMFVGYFWLYTFIQVLLAVAVYLLRQQILPN